MRFCVGVRCARRTANRAARIASCLTFAPAVTAAIIFDVFDNPVGAAILESRGRYADISELVDWAEAVGSSDPAAESVSASVPQPNLNIRFWDKYMGSDRKVLSGYDASEGARYVLFTAVLCHHPDVPPVLAVDNFDHALNPRLALALTRTVCERRHCGRGTRMKLRTLDDVIATDFRGDLADPEFALGYLQTSLDEAQSQDDIGTFLVALLDVTKARESVASVANRAGKTRASFYKSLSSTGNPEFATVVRALPALGMRLQVVSAAAASVESSATAEIKRPRKIQRANAVTTPRE